MIESFLFKLLEFSFGHVRIISAFIFPLYVFVALKKEINSSPYFERVIRLVLQSKLIEILERV